MPTYETFARVDEQGRVQVVGVPFAEGTEVQVTVSPKGHTEVEITDPDDDLTAARDRVRELFRSIKGFRNSPRMTREDLYERGSLDANILLRIIEDNRV